MTDYKFTVNENTYKYQIVIIYYVLIPNVMELRVIVFNATFTNISVTSWRSVLLMEKTGVPVDRGYHRERGWNQQIMMLENGRFYHLMYLRIL